MLPQLEPFLSIDSTSPPVEERSEIPKLRQAVSVVSADDTASVSELDDSHEEGEAARPGEVVKMPPRTSIPNPNLLPTSMNPHHASQQLMSDEDHKAVNDLLFQGSAVGYLMWLLLVLFVFAVPSDDSFEYLEGNERQACWTFLAVLFATNGSRLGPLIFQNDGFHFFRSGLLVGSFTIQFIAMVSNWMMVAVPTPIIVDPITGARVHLLRVATWVPLAFIMTFLTEAIDLKSNPSAVANGRSATNLAWWHATAMAASTAGGMIFPFCTNKLLWWKVMAVSWMLFATIFVRLYQRYSRYQRLRQQLEEQEQRQQQADSTKQKPRREAMCLLSEGVDRARSSFKMILLCTISWTAIAVSYTVCCFCPQYAPKDSILASEELSLLLGFALEAVSKIWYLSLQIHVYEKVFDENTRAVRRLNELRTLMSALWEASSDVLVICAESETSIHAVVSPSPLLKDQAVVDSEVNNTTTMMEISKINRSYFSFPMDLSRPITGNDADRIQRARETATTSINKFSSTAKGATTTKEKNLRLLADLACQVCSGAGEPSWSRSMVANATWPMQEMHRYLSDTNKETVVRCETKVTPIDTGGVLIVLRDVSERYQRFEVEKQLLEEVIVRKKDAEAIRFTRHEVKNGLLAAIGIVDAMKEEKLDATNPHIRDLDVALKDVLGAILDNAMIREVVYEGYVPRRESVDLPTLLDPKQRVRSSCGGANISSRQFPLFVSPQPFPHLLLDPQLIHKIYQNAVSNACKYGQKDGDVKTLLSYDNERKLFRMEVVNLPGYGHDSLVKLTKEEVNAVFQEGTQLKINQCLKTEEGRLASARSAGDGAWIMEKCAQCLGGGCDISYKPDGTTLSFECPAEICEEWRKRQLNATSHEGSFALPESTYAVVLEDSPMQRKLLDRFLKKAGIERCVVLGKSAEEIFAFRDTTKTLMKENPEDKFLLIVDENLDILEGGAITSTVSGSFSVQKLREELEAADESRMLALIRSANDSVDEVELYKSRAHGFLLKGPMKKGGLLQEIKPWWKRRFAQREILQLRCDTREKSPGPNNNDSCSSSQRDEFGPTRARVLELVKGIDALCGYQPLDVGDDWHSSFTSTSRFRGQDWQPIRYKLLLLNVDLKINLSRDHLALAATAIDDLTSKDNDCDSCAMPDHLLNKWIEIRELITRGVKD